MIKSKFFWAAAILLALVPFIIMDIPKHYVDWERDVHDEMIYVAQNLYHYSTAQKATALDQILASNKSLMAMMYIKSFVGIILFAYSIYFFVRYRRQGNASFWKALSFTVLLIAIVVPLKLYSWTSFGGDERIKLLNITGTDTTLNSIYGAHFKGKVVYVDFWGTTCGPCLNEFRDFTKPLKAKYHDRKDIAYLYICGGQKIVWKQQLKKFDVEGSHIFLNESDYNTLFRRSVRGSKDTAILMPRYLIIDKHGKIAETSAAPPSEPDSAYAQLDKYLAVK